MARQTLVFEVGDVKIYDDCSLIRMRLAGEDGSGDTIRSEVALNPDQADKLAKLLCSFANVTR